MIRARLRRKTPRRGALAVETAVLLSALCVPCMLAVDLARAFQAASIVDNCARNGALAWADLRIAKKIECLNPSTGIVDIQKAALLGVEDLDPPPTIAWVTKTDAAGHDYIEVTASRAFGFAIQVPGFSNEPITVTRKASMRRLPLPPSGGTAP